MTSEEDDSALPVANQVLSTRRESYTVVKLLGKGGYGAVYEVTRGDNKKFAIKCEKEDARKKVLMMDCCVLRGAQQIKSRHFCTISDRGKVSNRFAFLVMQLIGKNLWDLRVERDSMRFTMGTSLKAAVQCLICIEELHRIGFLHRDIKPGNFAIGLEPNQQIIYMLDFGLSRQFAKAEARQDVRKQRNNAPFRGTTRYAPLTAMKEEDQSRKDDIEAWLYMVVEWTASRLPWRKFKAEDRDEVLKMKMELRNPNGQAMDIFLTDCPKREFARILKYVDDLNYFSIPDYKFVYECVNHAMKSNNVKWSEPLDWDEKREYTAPVEIPGDGRLIVLEAADDEENKGASKEISKEKIATSKENSRRKTLMTAVSKEKTASTAPSSRSKRKK